MSDDPSHHLVLSKRSETRGNNKVSRQRESFSSNRLIHEAIICCTTSYRFDLTVYGALC